MTEPPHHPLAMFPQEDPSALTRQALNAAIADLLERINDGGLT